MNGHVVGEARQLTRKALDPFDEERGVRDARSLRTPRAAREGIGACIDGDRERCRLGPRAVQNVATVARAHIHENVAERGGYGSGLTDVDVDEALADKSTHVVDAISV